MTDIVGLSHDRGMLVMLQGMLHAYAGSMSRDKPVRAKMIDEALALVAAVRDEVCAEQSEMLAAYETQHAQLTELAERYLAGPYADD